MPDPREIDLRKVPDKRSPLMKAKSANSRGEIINMCPFGCEDGRLDQNGYCRHLVGFTNDGKHYEPMVMEKGRRIVKPRYIEGDAHEDGTVERIPVLEDVLPTDKLVQITTSSRVYRDISKQPAQKAAS